LSRTIGFTSYVCVQCPNSMQNTISNRGTGQTTAQAGKAIAGFFILGH